MGSRSQPASACSSKQRRDQERQAAEQAERAYQILVAHLGAEKTRLSSPFGLTIFLRAQLSWRR